MGLVGMTAEYLNQSLKIFTLAHSCSIKNNNLKRDERATHPHLPQQQQGGGQMRGTLPPPKKRGKDGKTASLNKSQKLKTHFCNLCEAAILLTGNKMNFDEKINPCSNLNVLKVSS